MGLHLLCSEPPLYKAFFFFKVIVSAPDNVKIRQRGNKNSLTRQWGEGAGERGYGRDPQV